MWFMKSSPPEHNSSACEPVRLMRQVIRPHTRHTEVGWQRMTARATPIHKGREVGCAKEPLSIATHRFGFVQNFQSSIAILFYLVHLFFPAPFFINAYSFFFITPLLVTTFIVITYIVLTDSKYFTHINLFNPHNSPMRVSTIVILILPKSKMKYREVK